VLTTSIFIPLTDVYYASSAFYLHWILGDNPSGRQLLSPLLWGILHYDITAVPVTMAKIFLI
jgi:hypothetical protein